jgi:hypothetical protein
MSARGREAVKANELAVRAVRAARRRARRNGRAAVIPLRQSPANKFRLVPDPVFVLSYLRSGSTLMRVVLNSHSQICAPIEMHLRALKVNTQKANLLELALKELELSNRDLENMLWDRILYDQLSKSGKSLVVDKTPHNTLSWERIHRYWPRAKFIILNRHPVPVVKSMMKAHPNAQEEQWAEQITRFARALDRAYEVHGGLKVRYEDLTRTPEKTTREICTFLGLPWEPQMIDYGTQQHGGFTRGLGDWSDKIKTGSIEPAPPDPAPEDIPPYLTEACKLMGYL